MIKLSEKKPPTKNFSTQKEYSHNENPDPTPVQSNV